MTIGEICKVDFLSLSCVMSFVFNACMSTPSWFKVVGEVGGGGGPCDYCARHSPKIGFWELLGYSQC